MFVFAILYFGIITDAGTLEPVINAILRAVGAQPTRVVIGFGAAGAARPPRRLRRGHVPRRRAGDAAALRPPRHRSPRARVRGVDGRGRELPAVDGSDDPRLGVAAHSRRAAVPSAGAGAARRASSSSSPSRGTSGAAQSATRGVGNAGGRGGIRAPPGRRPRSEPRRDQQLRAAAAAAGVDQRTDHGRDHGRHDRRHRRSRGHVHDRHRAGADDQLPRPRRAARAHRRARDGGADDGGASSSPPAPSPAS